ncbi:LCP family glycopolymer transferase [Sporosarcina sp. FA9]|uniref:LCP family glycopolymer transferase n=1 Tax=Sporosarcina sp. FA9 TaxID=3413030 RepID=UPI003F655FBF
MLLWIVGGFVILLLSGGGYLLMMYMNLTDTVEMMHEPIERELSDMREKPIVFKEYDPFSVLVLGVDERENDSGRSDTMIVLAVNPVLKSTKMVSIPRDTFTEIEGKGVKDKINHAYAFGGIEMAMKSVEHLLDIPIDYVVQVNMESFKEIVDAVGGITVNNMLNFKVGDESFQKGQLSLTGEEALTFVRMRYEDPRGDFGRQDRQKLVIQAILKQGASVNSLLNYKSIFSAIGTNVKTNMTFEEMIDVQANYRDSVNSIDQIYINEGHGKMINDIWYYIMNDDELVRTQNELKTHLEL